VRDVTTENDLGVCKICGKPATSVVVLSGAVRVPIGHCDSCNEASLKRYARIQEAYKALLDGGIHPRMAGRIIILRIASGEFRKRKKGS